MKKLIAISILLFCLPPVFAQGEKTAAEIATGKVGAEITRQVQEATSQAARVEQMVRSMDLGAALRYTEHAMQLSALEAARVPEVADLSSASNVQNALENAPKKSLHLQEKLANLKRVIWKKRAAKLFSPAAPQIKITNLPGEPTVKLGGNVDNLPKVLSARMLSGAENFRFIFPNFPSYSEKYLPSSLNTEEEFGYRGLKLYSLESVKHILENGLEWRRGGYKGKIFFTGDLNRVTDFITERTDSKLLPTIVKFNLPEDRRFIYTHQSLFNEDYYIWLRSIWAYSIQDVMVFLEVNGKPGWYKATLEGGALVFTPVPSRVFNRDEFIIHEFSIPEENQDKWW